MRNVSDESCTETQKTHSVLIKFCFSKIVPFMGYCAKILRAGQAPDNMAHGHCMLDNQGYKHAFRICNTYCFSTTTLVERSCLNVTLYVHCFSFLVLFSTIVLLKDKFKLNLTSNHNVNGNMCSVYAVNSHKLQNYVRLFSATCNEWHHDSDSGALLSHMKVRSWAEEDLGLTVESPPRLMCWHGASHSISNNSHFLHVN